MSKPNILIEEIWPLGSFQVQDAEKRLLDFSQELIIDLAHHDTRLTQEQVASWVAYVVLGVEA